MEISLIPPVNNLSLAKGYKYHLVLSHLLGNTQYRAFYADERKRGSYIILDNSAHEFQQGQPIDQLIKQASEINAQEIVIPDFLFNAKKTFQMAERAIEFLLTQGETFPHLLKPEIRFMVVPQAQTREEYERCLRSLLDLYYYQGRGRDGQIFNNPVTIGVSKDYEKWVGGLYSLLEDIVLPTRKTYDKEIQIHMLGWGRKLWDLNKVSQFWGHELRSVDSAKAVVYGQAGILLDPLQVPPPYPTRPLDYFDMRLDPDQIRATHHNINIFRKAAMGTLYKGTLYPVSTSIGE